VLLKASSSSFYSLVFLKLDKIVKKTGLKNSQKLVKLVITFVKLDSLTFIKLRNRFDKELPKEKL